MSTTATTRTEAAFGLSVEGLAALADLMATDGQRWSDDIHPGELARWVSRLDIEDQRLWI